MLKSPNSLYFLKNNIFFSTKEELVEYITENNLTLDNMYIVNFIGTYHGKEDCIQIIEDKKYIVCTPSLIGYYYFDENKDSWIGTYGSLKNEYEALKKIGIVLKHDIYETMDLLNSNCHGPSDKIFKFNKKVNKI